MHAGSFPRVMAMARPRRAVGEGDLVKRAAVELGATGSKRQRGAAVASAVARLALANMRQDGADFGAALELVEAALSTPSATALACSEHVDVDAILRREAVQQFEARSFRHLPQAEWAAADQELLSTVGAKLAERFRRLL